MAASSFKGNKVRLSTFFSWKLSATFGNKVKTINDIKFVKEVWCKICASNKGKILRHHAVKGASKVSVERFITNGTTFVTKHSVSVFQ